MRAMRRRARILCDEDGAVTPDWVVLTAAVAGLGVIVLAVVRVGAGDLRPGGTVSGHARAAIARRCWC